MGRSEKKSTILKDEELKSKIVDEPKLISPDEFPSWIVEEDDGILAVNKPGLIVCHPSKNGPWSSLVGASREYLNQELVHLVHRLDRETSGICILAKDKLRARHTQMAFQSKQVNKTYLAILEGEMPEPVHVKVQLAKDLDSEVYVKQTVRKSNSSKSSETNFIPLIARNGYTLAEVHPVTGRKHQIRVHAKYLDYPIVGDKVYGPDDRWYLKFIETGWLPEMEGPLKIKRQALHAWKITFDAPEYKRTFMAPLSSELIDFLYEEVKVTEQELITLGILAEEES